MTRKGRYSEEEGRQLLRLARKTIEERLRGAGGGGEAEGDPSARFTEPCGTFVTLTKGVASEGASAISCPRGLSLKG